MPLPADDRACGSGLWTSTRRTVCCSLICQSSMMCVVCLGTTDKIPKATPCARTEKPNEEGSLLGGGGAVNSVMMR